MDGVGRDHGRTRYRGPSRQTVLFAPSIVFTNHSRWQVGLALHPALVHVGTVLMIVLPSHEVADCQQLAAHERWVTDRADIGSSRPLQLANRTSRIRDHEHSDRSPAWIEDRLSGARPPRKPVRRRILVLGFQPIHTDTRASFRRSSGFNSIPSQRWPVASCPEGKRARAPLPRQAELHAASLQDRAGRGVSRLQEVARAA